MKVSGFAASADIVGRRVRIRWDFVPENAETLADVPPVVLRRKQRDFAFPDPVPPDPYLVYDSKAFPPAPVPNTLTVTDLSSWEIKTNGTSTIYEPVSVAAMMGGRLIEVMRRTIATSYDATGVSVRQRVEILDTGRFPGDLAANGVYYYQIFGVTLPPLGDEADADPYRSTAMVTDSYGLNRTLYESLPEIYRRHDVQTRALTAGNDTVPEESPRFGQLRRFVDLFGIALDSIRGTAEGLQGMHDIDRVDARFLPALTQWIAWDFSVGSSIPLRRNELKAAPRLFRLVGTLPGLRALVGQYTGWFTQVAEFAQNLALSNRPAQRNLFATTSSASGASWFGVDDAAELLGFGSGHQNAIGSTGVAASLTGTTTEPFALRPGMKLSIAVDGLLPETVRFGSGDFKDITKATAAEVATAIDFALADLQATGAGGKIVLTSDSVGGQSELEITPESSSLVSLDSASSGRLSPVVDALGHMRVFFEAWSTPTLPESQAPATGASAQSSAGNYVLRQIQYKTFADGAWGDSHPLMENSVVPQADPAALAMSDGSTFVTWVDNPQTGSAQLRYSIGKSQPLIPARVLGQRSEPFALKDGAVLTITGNWSGPDKYTVHAGDFANNAAATATEVVQAMNAQFAHVNAARENNGSIRLETQSGGALARIGVDLAHSTTARALGVDNRSAIGTPGSWNDEIDWPTPLDVVSIPVGRHSELTAIIDSAGGVRIAWACHRAGLWRINTAHWIEQILAGTANGLFLRAGAAAWTQIAGLPSNDVRGIAVDSNGTAWIATAAGVVLRRLDGTIAVLAPALPSPDVRSVKLASDGVSWFATALGVTSHAPDGTVTNLSTLAGLPSNDVRALAIAGDGAVWIATALGLAVRRPSGVISSFGTTAGIPSVDIRDVDVDSDGTVYVATAAGIASNAGGTFSTLPGLAASDVRALALGRNQTVWAATANGVSRFAANTWTNFNTADGLPSSDARAISLSPDGTAWIGTAAGLSAIFTDDTVPTPGALGAGLPVSVARSIHTGWSTALELAAGGAANREPVLTADQNNRIWLIWSSLLTAGDPNESWALHYRIYDPVGHTWGVEAVLTAPPGGGRASDRTPSPTQIPGGLRVFCSSDRDGGPRLWSVDVTLGGVVSPIVPVRAEASADTSPAPVTAGGAQWLLYRSDRNVSLAQVGSAYAQHSRRAADNGTTRRYAGTVSATLADLDRNRTGRFFGDLLCYTPNRPDGVALLEDELYTRGTVGLYVSRANRGSALTQDEASRLKALLQQFVPVNLRAVVIVVAVADAESVYTDTADIQESYSDVYPFADALGPITDQFAAAMPDVSVLESNTPGDVSADPANLATLRRRTFFPPFQ